MVPYFVNEQMRIPSKINGLMSNLIFIYHTRRLNLSLIPNLEVIVYRSSKQELVFYRIAVE